MRSKAALKYAATKLYDKVSQFNVKEKLKKLNKILKRPLQSWPNNKTIEFNESKRTEN